MQNYRRDGKNLRRTKAIAMMLVVALAVSFVAGMFNALRPSMGVDPNLNANEPNSLKDIVEFPETPGDTQLLPSDDPTGAIQKITDSYDWGNVTEALGQKGFTFDLAQATVEDVASSSLGGFFGYTLSAWSTEIGANGERAFISAMYEFNSNSTMVVAGITNLLPPDQVPEVDPYIIVNAMPYMYIRWYWYAWLPIGRVVSWNYWWYDSHSHPNWYWGCYWYWRNYVAYYWQGGYGKAWLPWWWWFWHWTYWRNWNWWSTYFDY